MPRSVTPDRLVAPDRFEALGQVVGQAHQADEAALADHGIVPPRPAGELLGARRSVVRRLLVGPGEREEFVRPQPDGMGDQGGKSVSSRSARRRLCRSAARCMPVRPRYAGLRERTTFSRSPFGSRRVTWSQHGLQRLTVHVEGFLAEIDGSAS